MGNPDWDWNRLLWEYKKLKTQLAEKDKEIERLKQAVAYCEKCLSNIGYDDSVVQAERIIAGQAHFKQALKGD